MFGLPENDFHDGQAGFPGPLKDQAGDVFGRGIVIHDEDTLIVGEEDGKQGILAAKQQIVVQVLVDPFLDLLLDLAEVHQHAAPIEPGALERDHRRPLWP